jgi:[ribosomal protein S5]-alanine N-acetyltransferase
MTWTNDCMTTQRLRLRAATELDKPVMAKLLQDPEVRQYLGRPTSAEDLQAFKDSTVGERWGSFVIADGAIDLAMGVLNFSDDRGEWELSCELLPRYWGRGFAVEAAKAAIEWAWADPAPIDAESIIAVTKKANLASIALLERLGFVHERSFSEDGASHALYRLHRSD